MATLEPAVRVIRHDPSAPLIVRYDLVSAYDEDPDDVFAKARPTVRPQWFFVHGESVFARPDEAETRPASFAWRDVSAGWTVASDLDHLRNRAGTVGEVVESITLGGTDVAVHERDVGGARFRLALRGGWSFAPGDLSRLLNRLAIAQNALWGDRGHPYLVAVAPLRPRDPSITSVNGSGRGDGFAVAATTNIALSDQSHFFSHELLHSWMASRLGGIEEEQPALSFWFSEGLTDLLAARALLRAGLWTLEDYVRWQNQTLRRYATSPARRVRNADIQSGFWTDRGGVGRLPYDRGNLLGELIDVRLRAASGSTLIEALRMVRRRADRAGRNGHPVTAPRLFQAVLRDQGGGDVAALVARHIESGEPILLPSETFAPCATIITTSERDARATDSTPVTVQRIVLSPVLSRRQRRNCVARLSR